VAPTVGPDGELTVGKQGMVEGVEDELWKLWKGPEPNMAAIEHLVRPFKGLREPHRKTTLSADLLFRTAQKISAKKAAGPDDWAGNLLNKAWPKKLWSRVETLLARVEETGVWPDSLRKGTVVLLPKGGSGAALGFRPIVLLPFIYRMWARVRAKDLEYWMNQVGIRPLPGSCKGEEKQGLLLTLAVEQAMAQGLDAGGLALDSSKTYDRIALEFLSKVAEAARMPKWLVAPMLDMYRAPRQVRIMDTYGELKVPTHGLVPGCPAATF
jgi:hypothetical protein